jgi:hypothetical protein
MLEMFMNSARMMLRGKLFRDNKMVIRQWAIGFSIAIALIVLLGKFVVPIWAAAMIGGFATGAAMPYLFKDLKYN